MIIVLTFAITGAGFSLFYLLSCKITVEKMSAPTATLADELREKQIELETKFLPKEAVALMQSENEKLQSTSIIESALAVGAKAPEFELTDSKTKKPFNSNKALEKGPLAVVFYRGGWCPYCNVANKALQRRYTDIEAAGGQLVVIAPETPENVEQTATENELSFPALSDPNSDVARRFGLVFQLTAELDNLYTKGFKLDLRVRNGSDKAELPLPATYIIAQDGTVAHRYVDVDYKRREEPALIVAKLQELAGKAQQ